MTSYVTETTNLLSKNDYNTIPQLTTSTNNDDKDNYFSYDTNPTLSWNHLKEYDDDDYIPFQRRIIRNHCHFRPILFTNPLLSVGIIAFCGILALVGWKEGIINNGWKEGTIFINPTMNKMAIWQYVRLQPVEWVVVTADKNNDDDDKNDDDDGWSQQWEDDDNTNDDDGGIVAVDEDYDDEYSLYDDALNNNNNNNNSDVPIDTASDVPTNFGYDYDDDNNNTACCKWYWHIWDNDDIIHNNNNGNITTGKSYYPWNSSSIHNNMISTYESWVTVEETDGTGTVTHYECWTDDNGMTHHQYWIQSLNNTGTGRVVIDDNNNNHTYDYHESIDDKDCFE